jgi:hypothetical protein
MKIVLTLIVRDEADIIDAQIAFHLNAGVDFVLALDHESQDGTTEILESYARAGVLRRLEGKGPFREVAWRTMLARRAATDHAADWVVNADADQFWWPRVGTMREAFADVPSSYGIIRCLDRVFVPRPGDGSHFAERMVYRFVSRAPLNIPWSTYRPLPRVLHRADPGISVSRGSHRVSATRLAPFPSWSPVEVLHFPWRSEGQMRRKAASMRRAFSHTPQLPVGYHDVARRALEQNAVEDRYASLAVDESAVSHGVETGCLVRDTRVRDVLRRLAGLPVLPAPAGCSFDSVLGGDRVPLPEESPSARLEFEFEAVAAQEADIVRLRRRLDQVVARVAGLEA